MDWKRFRMLLWARRMLLAIATGSAFLGAAVGDRISPRHYEGSAKVDLQIVKPDPVTGYVVTSKNVDAFVDSQIMLIRDYQVASRAAEALGWLDRPDFQEFYVNLPGVQEVDFRHWVAQQLSEATSARMVRDSNILEITYRAPTPEMAVAGVDALRAAYIESTIETRRQVSRGIANFALGEANRYKAKLIELERQKSELERETGVVTGVNGADLEGGRLRAIATTTSRVGNVRTPGATSAAIRLAQLDQVIGGQEQALGPNNPALLALKRRRASLAAQVGQERAGQASAASVRQGNQRASEGRMGEQIAKVLSQREPVAQLRLVQDEIAMNRASYEKATARNVEMLQVANVETNVFTPVGLAESSDELTAGRRPVALLGAAGLGLAVGILLAVLSEMVARRVRTTEDLQDILGGTLCMTLPKVRASQKAGAAKAAIGRKLNWA